MAKAESSRNTCHRRAAGLAGALADCQLDMDSGDSEEGEWTDSLADEDSMTHA